MKIATLCFLLRDGKICLGLKKRGFGEGKYNGFGGKVADKEEFKDESVEESVIREGQEEFGITVISPRKVAVVKFVFPDNPSWDHFVHVFVANEWGNKMPEEGEEMSPQWFNLDEIPYEKMWDDDKYWLPELLSGKNLRAEFYFNSEGIVTSHAIGEVSAFINKERE